jgi:hypothetical protein
MPYDGDLVEHLDLAVLRAARAGIADPDRWCKRAARMQDRRCSAGWVRHEYERITGEAVAPIDYAEITVRALFPALRWWSRVASALFIAPFAPLLWLRIRSQLPAGTRTPWFRFALIVRFNDTQHRSHRQVVALFDRAIAQLEAKHRAI